MVAMELAVATIPSKPDPRRGGHTGCLVDLYYLNTEHERAR